MSAEARVLVATMVLAALLTGLAWWLAQHRPPRAYVDAHTLETTQITPWLVRPAPSTTSRDATTSTDASIASDVGPSTEARDRLGALLVAQICARRAECLCGTYPSPYAEGHEAATTCQVDVLRDFLRWWDEQVSTPVVLVAEAELVAAIHASVDCEGTDANLDDLLRADAAEGESCGSVGECRDGSACWKTTCERQLSTVGEACGEHTRDGAQGRHCTADARCVAGRCEPRLREGHPCNESSDDCAAGLVCVGSCVRRPGEGEECDELPCAEGLRCRDERCVAQLVCEPMLRRDVRRRRMDEFEVPQECIPVGTPCRCGSDCGSGWCEGAGRWTCDVPGRLGFPTPEPLFFASTPPCPSGGSCLNCECVPSEVCVRDLEQGDDRCMRVIQRGEPCGPADCAEGLDCDYRVPAGGRCVANLCVQTVFFH